MALDEGSRRNRRGKFGLWLAFAAVLTAMLIAGLSPGGYRFRNEAHWIQDGPGLRFEKFGIAYTSPFLTGSAASGLNQSGVTLLLGLMLTHTPSGGFQFIASFHNCDDRSQLVIAQWRNSLIVMNGDDYSYVRRMPRVSADLTRFMDRPILLAISTSPSGTLLAADGEVIGHGEGIQILIPIGTRNSRLILGNSVHSDDGWNGSLFSFGMLSRPLSGSDLQQRHERWQETHDLKFVPPTETVQLLHFDERAGNIVRDFSGAANHVILPARPTALARSLLSDDPTHEMTSNSRLKDFTLNLLGFIPFGLLLAIMLSNRGYQARHVLTAVTLWGFAFSLGIETLQSWIPTRSSSLTDLLLNTLGAAIGALGSKKIGSV